MTTMMTMTMMTMTMMTSQTTKNKKNALFDVHFLFLKNCFKKNFLATIVLWKKIWKPFQQSVMICNHSKDKRLICKCALAEKKRQIFQANWLEFIQVFSLFLCQMQSNKNEVSLTQRFCVAMSKFSQKISMPFQQNDAIRVFCHFFPTQSCMFRNFLWLKKASNVVWQNFKLNIIWTKSFCIFCRNRFFPFNFAMCELCYREFCLKVQKAFSSKLKRQFKLWRFDFVKQFVLGNSKFEKKAKPASRAYKFVLYLFL